MLAERHARYRPLLAQVKPVNDAIDCIVAKEYLD